MTPLWHLWQPLGRLLALLQLLPLLLLHLLNHLLLLLRAAAVLQPCQCPLRLYQGHLVPLPSPIGQSRGPAAGHEALYTPCLPDAAGQHHRGSQLLLDLHLLLLLMVQLRLSWFCGLQQQQQQPSAGPLCWGQHLGPRVVLLGPLVLLVGSGPWQLQLQLRRLGGPTAVPSAW
jgi:hypothetical protein